jgi:hypothetical protein
MRGPPRESRKGSPKVFPPVWSHKRDPQSGVTNGLPKGNPPRAIPKGGAPRGSLGVPKQEFCKEGPERGPQGGSPSGSPHGFPDCGSRKLFPRSLFPKGVPQAGSPNCGPQGWHPNGFPKGFPELGSPRLVPKFVSPSLVTPIFFPIYGTSIRPPVLCSLMLFPRGYYPKGGFSRGLPDEIPPKISPVLFPQFYPSSCPMGSPH